MTRPLDPAFVQRHRETSTGLAAVGLLVLLAEPAPWPVVASFVVGFGLAVSFWAAAEVVTSRVLGPDRVSKGEALRLAALHAGKYLLAAAAIGALNRGGWLHGAGFVAGFALPVLTLLLKTIGWLVLPEDSDPAAVYSRHRAGGQAERIG